MNTTHKSSDHKSSEVSEVVDKGQAQIHEGLRTTEKKAEEYMSAGHVTSDAVMKATQVWTAGVQDLAKQVAASAQSSLDEALATFKALLSVNSPQEALELETKAARSALERTLAESSRIGDTSIKLFEQTLAPLAARASQAVEKVKEKVEKTSKPVD
jgi:phasin family protein